MRGRRTTSSMRDLFYFSSIPWSYFHHRQQEICLYLASRGYRVFFIEPFQRGKETGPSIREIGKNIVLARAKGLPYERVLQMVNLINSRETNILLQCLINRYFIKRPICILDRVHGIDLRYVSSLGPIVCDLVDEITAFGRIKNKAMLRKLEKKQSV